MRKLILLRGLPGSGKSTWLKSNGLENYALSSDQFRLQFRSPVMQISGEASIDQKASPLAWTALKVALENRMKNGDLTVVDATHVREKEINSYRTLCEKYRYEAALVDFQLDLEEVLRRNFLRKGLPSFVAEEVIRNYSQMAAAEKIPGWIKVIKPEEINAFLHVSRVDFQAWKKINHIGDLQSCYTPLQKLLSEGLKADELYIFLGDFLDRGLEPVEVLSFLLNISELPNVIFIEGNHEFYLWEWAQGIEVQVEEFRKTQAKLDLEKFDKRRVKALCRKFHEALVYTYHDKVVLLSHGGLPFIPKPDEMALISANTFIRGAGVYGDDVDEAFNSNSRLELGFYQIHGHRNRQDNPIKNGRSWNLEGKVEFGGHLRSVSLSKEGFSPVEVLNDVETPLISSESDLLAVLRTSRFIRERDNGNDISSFNFSKAAFFDGVWNSQTVRARGLFINTKTKEIVSRSYDKFFNVGELSLTSMDSLKHNLRFPVDVYVKENGFLGIVGYDRVSDSAVVSSKASTQNDFAGWFRNILFKSVKSSDLKDFVRTGYSLIFEVIDPENDPHIIKYNEPKVVLLDAIRNEATFSKLPYVELKALAGKLGVEVKKLHTTLQNWREFEEWNTSLSSKEDQDRNHSYIEGFVIEDQRLFMTKIKLPYYSFWKYMRSIKDRYAAGKPILLPESPEGIQFVNWLRTISPEEAKKGIAELRDVFDMGKKKENP